MSYIGNIPTTVAFLVDTFSGNGSTTAFTLSQAPATTSSILVAVSGVVQDPSTYSVSGTTLTFSGAPPSGTSNISVRFLGIPASGVATTAYRTLTTFTATSGQTTFSVPSYTVGYIDVYRNGVKLGTADFTATSGTSVVLASGATAGDLVETISFFVSSVLNAIPAVANAVTETYINTGAVTTTKIADANVTTTKIADANVTPAKLSQPFTSGTAVASTSGTSIDFTGIPSWVRRITVMFSAVSTNGSSFPWLIQIGPSGGVETSGYLGGTSNLTSTTSASNVTNGFGLNVDNSSNTVANGSVVLTLLNSSTNTWTAFGMVAQSDRNYNVLTAGSKSLAGTLTRVRITTNGGTDTFDNGTINILYE